MVVVQPQYFEFSHILQSFTCEQINVRTIEWMYEVLHSSTNTYLSYFSSKKSMLLSSIISLKDNLDLPLTCKTTTVTIMLWVKMNFRSNGFNLIWFLIYLCLVFTITNRNKRNVKSNSLGWNHLRLNLF